MICKWICSDVMGEDKYRVHSHPVGPGLMVAVVVFQ